MCNQTYGVGGAGASGNAGASAAPAPVVSWSVVSKPDLVNLHASVSQATEVLNALVENRVLRDKLSNAEARFARMSKEAAARESLLQALNDENQDLADENDLLRARLELAVMLLRMLGMQAKAAKQLPPKPEPKIHVYPMKNVSLVIDGVQFE